MRFSKSTRVWPAVKRFKDLKLATDLESRMASIKAAVRVECGGEVSRMPPQHFTERLIVFVLRAIFDSDGDDVVVVVAGSGQVSAYFDGIVSVSLLWRSRKRAFAI